MERTVTILVLYNQAPRSLGTYDTFHVVYNLLFWEAQIVSVIVYCIYNMASNHAAVSSMKRTPRWVYYRDRMHKQLQEMSRCTIPLGYYVVQQAVLAWELAHTSYTIATVVKKQ